MCRTFRHPNLCFFFILFISRQGFADSLDEIVARPGDDILLSCEVNTETCGPYHSLKWYREDTRVYVYSPTAQFSNAEGPLINRCLNPDHQSLGPSCVRGTLEVTDTAANLRIAPVELTDEGQYRCEITYLDISNNCPIVHFTEVTTVAPPNYVVIRNREDEEVSNNVVGPFAAGDELSFSCEAFGAKPTPTITWLLGEDLIEGELSENVEEDGSWTVKNEVNLVLDRSHTGSSLSCIVEHEELDSDMESTVQIDVNVPLASVAISVESDLQENLPATLICKATGGRPAPQIEWSLPEGATYNAEMVMETLDDETFELTSNLIFTPTAEENLKQATCKAWNDVMEEPIEDIIDLDVKYAPIVYMEESNETVTMGDRITISCLVDANPPEILNVKWFRNDELIDEENSRLTWEIGSNPSLHLENVEPSDDGQYTCGSENAIGSTLSEVSFNLEVTAPVKSVLIQEELSAVADEEMSITCVAKGSRPAASIIWRSPSIDDTQMRVEETSDELEDKTFEVTSVLHFTSRREDNGMQIICEAGNDAMEETLQDERELNIMYAPMITIEEENITAQIGDEVKLGCIVDANPSNLTSIEWYHEENLVTVEEEAWSDYLEILQFRSINASNAGEYYCKVKNDVGESESQKIIMNVIAPIQAVRIDGSEGREEVEMTLSCTASGGRPAATIAWKFPDDIQFTTEEDILEDEGTFKSVSYSSFVPSAEMNGVKVFCSALNDVMDEPMEFETELNILHKPIINIEEENQTLTTGEEITFHCDVEANPMNISFVRWYHGDKLIYTSEEIDVESDDLTLIIMSLSPEDSGKYYCSVANEMGESMSYAAHLEVLYPPVVEIHLVSDGHIIEEDNTNVTLKCQLVDGNPLTLDTVHWFMNGQLIRTLPEAHCGSIDNNQMEELFTEEFISGAKELEMGSGLEDSDMVDIGSGMEFGSAFLPDDFINMNGLCDVDPTELFLQQVSREFSGNFSCSGANVAGEGQIAEAISLDVLYAPSKAEIKASESAVKGSSVTLTCELLDQGNPTAEQFLWTKDGEHIEESSDTLILQSLSAESQGNISCSAKNDIGEGDSGYFNLVVQAPPSFLIPLGVNQTFVSHLQDQSLTCQVECYPLCNIKWAKDGEEIQDTDEKYNISQTTEPEDVELNKFPSVISELSWNLHNWPENRFSHEELNFLISCFVDDSEVGDSISTSAMINIEYAPENVEVSAASISIEEHNSFDPVFCSGEANPEPTVVWKFNEQEIISENTLDFSEPIRRNQGGLYSCHISNEHGEEVVNVTVDVLYKPECSINWRVEAEEIFLICSAEANPEDVTFLWKKDNSSFEGQAVEGKIESQVVLRRMNESAGTYSCFTSNPVGEGDACILDLTNEMIAYGLSHEVMVILIAVAGSVIVLLIIIIITACLYCGEKKQSKGKVPLKKNKSKSPLLKDDLTHADPSFYENLPFKGLRNPPKQVLADRNSDMLDYADADYLDIYANGPLKYREASEKNATLRRQKLEERKSVKSEIL